jgi:hypothetical protein
MEVYCGRIRTDQGMGTAGLTDVVTCVIECTVVVAQSFWCGHKL